MDGEALRDDATPVVDEGGGIDVDMGLGIDMDIGRGWFSTRLSWRASCSRVRGTCACEEGGPRGEGEVDVELRQRFVERWSGRGDDGRARLGMGTWKKKRQVIGG